MRKKISHLTKMADRSTGNDVMQFIISLADKVLFCMGFRLVTGQLVSFVLERVQDNSAQRQLGPDHSDQ